MPRESLRTTLTAKPSRDACFLTASTASFRLPNGPIGRDSSHFHGKSVDSLVTATAPSTTASEVPEEGSEGLVFITKMVKVNKDGRLEKIELRAMASRDFYIQ